MKAAVERVAGAALPVWCWEKLFRLALRKAHRSGDQFLTYHDRPKRASDVGLWSDPRPDLPTLAVVLQGPLLLTNDFTVETVRLYRRTFAGCPLIVSTWEGEDTATVARLRDAGAEVLLNRKPDEGGPANINMQLTSALAGVRRAAELGAEYTLKTRTDHRLYAPNLAPYLISTLISFPVQPGYSQQARTVHLSFGSSKYTMYSLSDMFVFGTTMDSELYWAAPHKRGQMPMHATLGEIARARCTPEVYLVTRFLEQIGRKLEWTIQDSWVVYANHFCTVDSVTVDLMWPKYGFDREHRFRRYDAIYTDKELSFSEWMSLYAGQIDKLPGAETISALAVATVISEQVSQAQSRSRPTTS